MTSRSVDVAITQELASAWKRRRRLMLPSSYRSPCPWFQCFTLRVVVQIRTDDAAKHRAAGWAMLDSVQEITFSLGGGDELSILDSVVDM